MREKIGSLSFGPGPVLWGLLGLAVAAVVGLGTFVKVHKREETARLALPQMHRAVYDLSIDNVNSTSETQTLDGRMVVEWRGGPACEGYTSDQRVVTTSIDSDGTSSVSDVRLNSWEAIDGNDFRFDRTEYLDGKLSNRETGEVKRADGKAVLTEPKQDPVVLPADVMFPSAFNIELIKAAEQGAHVYSGVLFDGTQTAASNITVFIGKPGSAPADARKVPIKNIGKGDPLASTPAWPVHMSYFDIGEDGTSDDTPSFEMGFSMFPNGVMSALKLDYDDVTLKGELKDIEYFKPGAC